MQVSVGSAWFINDSSQLLHTLEATQTSVEAIIHTLISEFNLKAETIDFINNK